MLLILFKLMLKFSITTLTKQLILFSSADLHTNYTGATIIKFLYRCHDVNSGRRDVNSTTCSAHTPFIMEIITIRYYVITSPKLRENCITFGTDNLRPLTHYWREESKVLNKRLIICGCGRASVSISIRCNLLQSLWSI